MLVYATMTDKEKSPLLNPNKRLKVALWAFGKKDQITLMDLLELPLPEYKPAAVDKILRFPGLNRKQPLTVPYASPATEEAQTQRGVFRGAHTDGLMRESARDSIRYLQEIKLADKGPER